MAHFSTFRLLAGSLVAVALLGSCKHSTNNQPVATSASVNPTGELRVAAGDGSVRDQTPAVEFKIVDDETDIVGAIASRARNDELPEGVSLDHVENALLGPGKVIPIHYAMVARKESETLAEARKRLSTFLARYEIPNAREIGYSVVYEEHGIANRRAATGWRTYLLFSQAFITDIDVRDVAAVPDPNGDWQVALTFNDAGRDRVAEVTTTHVKRRFAIVVDGRVQSVPIIQSPIDGGYAKITLAASNPHNQLEEARHLESVLRGRR